MRPVHRRPAGAPERPLRIVMLSSEAVPFSKSGGLADVTTALSRALARLGHEVTLITPRYRGVNDGERRHTVRAFVSGHWFEAALREAPLGDGLNALLVDCPPLYDRGGLYVEHHRDYPDNALRFAFLSIAALDWAAAQATPPSVFHLHDWQSSLTPTYARQSFPQLNAPFVLTIHNLAYQGIFPKSWVPALGLRWEDFTVNGFEFYDQLNFLKAGIVRSDALTTVSRRYAQEIQRPEAGYGLDGVIRARRGVLTGILNGIDVEQWNPATDRHLRVHYSDAELDTKREVKRELLATFGLPIDGNSLERPIVGMVSRLVNQKGMDLIQAIAPHLRTLDATFIVVGSGHPRYEQMWRSLASSDPERVGVFIGFDEARAHLVEAGADMFLMPSLYEPCGLGQMYSLRYGTVPIVRAVGGLADTVVPHDAATGNGNGFVFARYDPAELLSALREAIAVYRNTAAWRRLQLNGMHQDFSWTRAAAEYVQVYERVLRVTGRAYA